MIMQLVLLAILLMWSIKASARSLSLAKPNCQAFCGEISIPFPFGIGPGCYSHEWSEIVCNGTFSPPKSFAKSMNLEVLNISIENNGIHVNLPITSSGCNGATTSSVRINLESSPFAFSQRNKFTATGCDNLALLSEKSTVIGGCMPLCHDQNKKLSADGYLGVNRCQATIPSDLREYNASIGGMNNNEGSKGCKYAFLVDQQWFAANFAHLQVVNKMESVPVVLEWCWHKFCIIGLGWLYKVEKKRKNFKFKEKFFKRNGGLLLQQQLCSGEVNVNTTKLFRSSELEKATDHFSVHRKVGQGGQGTVYKGMLADGRIVAVKKSGLVSEGKLEKFINEVTEVPLLVYEFIHNGTLSQFLHDQLEEFPLTWDMRLRIAIEVAEALSYLHSAASLPIYHRDIKSSNILLDEKYRAKVADFGISKSVAIDQTHVTTQVQGTFGYLDPEYFQSSQFTEKSDVYSYGVVLVELLTRQKPNSSTRSEEDGSLILYFMLCLEENRLGDIINAELVLQAQKEVIVAVAKVAYKCLNINRKKRPTMKEVTKELEDIQILQNDFNANPQNYEDAEHLRCDLSETGDALSPSNQLLVHVSIDFKLHKIKLWQSLIMSVTEANK
uniref:Protein kinase domain-containing protein n=1 Tax=Populus trichocarpa TaxID=3694 RepID=A0A2K2AJL7_POPTR